MMTASDILRFWFEETPPARWWKPDPAFDRLLGERFGRIHAQAVQCELHGWRGSAQGRLAEIIVLDQFSRNIHRDTPKAFACDGAARGVATRAIARGFERHLDFDQRLFLYLPFEHSEDLADQRRAVALFRGLAEEQVGKRRDMGFELVGYAERHCEIIERFGRFPHRNATLGRETTAAEEAFLRGPNSSF